MEDDSVSFDLNQFDDDDDFLEKPYALGIDLSSILNKDGTTSNDAQNFEIPTLESILNEDDDDENDEILKILTTSMIHSESNKTINFNNTTEVSENLETSNEGFSKDHEGTKVSKSSSLSRVRGQSTTRSQYSSLTEKNGIVCRQTTLKQISSQLIVAIERSDSGLPTVLTVGQLIAVGTSRGLILLFDLMQILKLYITTEFKDGISALSFNNSCDRLLAGNALGHIFMFDATNGKLLRQITDAHPMGNSILNLKFTDDSKLACFSDSGGSVFMLEFKRVMGVRGADSTCLFSGSRGEVCTIEPLRFEKFADTILDKLNANSSRVSSSVKKNLANVSDFFNKFSLLAMASFTKVFVVTLKPKLTVLFTFPLTGNAKYLPIISWQFVILQKLQQSDENPQAEPQYKRFITPILACARESTINFFQVDYVLNNQSSTTSTDTKENRNDKSALDSSPETKTNKVETGSQAHDAQFNFQHLQKCEFKYKILNFCWLNAKTLAILDHGEKLHICDIRSQEELQVLANLHESVQLVYNSCFFKSLATGGHVSEALAYAGESACYQTFQSYLGQLFILGTKSITLFSLQSWSSRIDDFVNDNSLELALNLALSMFKSETKALVGLPMDSALRKEKIIDKIIDILYLYVNRAMKQDCPSDGKLEVLAEHYRKCSSKCVQVCITIDRQDLLFDNLYNLLNIDPLFEGFFFESLEEYILENNAFNSRKSLTMPPIVIKNFIDYYSNDLSKLSRLEKCLLKFDIATLDLHNVIQLCRKHSMLDAFIHLFNKAFIDYITPIDEMIVMMQPLMFLVHEVGKEHLKKNQSRITTYGNKLLVYIHSCLCGQSYPFGKIEDDQLSDQVRRMTFDYLTSPKSALIDKLLASEKQDPSSPLAKYLNELTMQNSNSYPIIRIFLNYDVLDFLNVISMTFNEPSFEAVVGLDKKQQLIDILIEISLKKTSSKFVLSDQLVGHLFTFLARQIGKKSNNIQVENEIFAQIVEYLCNREESDRAEEREQTLLYLVNSYSIEIVEKFNLDSLLNLSLRVQFNRVCEVLYELKGEFYNIVDCYLDKENSFERQKKIFDVVRNLLDLLYESSNSNASSISTGQKQQSSLLFSNNQNQSTRVRSFTAIQQLYSQQNARKTSIAIEPRDIQLRKLQERLINKEALQQMIQINPTETIHLLWIEMNIDLKFIISAIQSFFKNKNGNDEYDENENKDELNDRDIDAIDASMQQKREKFKKRNKVNFEGEDTKSLLSSDSLASIDNSLMESYEEDKERLLYKFMKGLFDLAELIKIDRKYINYMSQFGVEFVELYVDLICYYEPEKLLYFLKTILSDYSYRIEECLRICRARKVWDGAAYLLEKSGQIEAAFSLNLEKITSTIKELQRNLETLSDAELNATKSNIDALIMSIVQLCQRNSSSLNDGVKEKIWFSLFSEVMRPIGSLFIDPSIEKLLEFDSKETTNEIEGTNQSKVNIKQRLSETKEFFKYLGTYIINSMVGYISLTTIIDRIICDPIYGPSNIGDIKDLIMKMLEMCSYENTLLLKTSSLVSKDVYIKLLNYKRLCSKSYSSFTDHCQYCSRPFISNTQTGLFELTSYDNNEELITSSNLNDKLAMSIFHCGHSFHKFCLESIQAKKETLCPLCSANSYLTNKAASPISQQKSKPNKYLAEKYRQKTIQPKALKASNNLNDDLDINDIRQMSLDDSNLEINSKLTPQRNPIVKDLSGAKSELQTNSLNGDNSTGVFSLQLSETQIAALKSIRTRNQTSIKFMNSSSSNFVSDQLYSKNERSMMVEKRSQLKLSPANIMKYI